MSFRNERVNLTPKISDRQKRGRERDQKYRDEATARLEYERKEPERSLYDEVDDILIGYGSKAEGYTRSIGHPFATREQVIEDHGGSKIRIENKNRALDISVTAKTTEELNELVAELCGHMTDKERPEGGPVKISPAWTVYKAG
jgi:hypothetical protein